MTPNHLKTIEQRLLWLSHWMIPNANTIRPKAGGIKVGGPLTGPLAFRGAARRGRPRRAVRA